jgi:hypothetical protein
VLPVAEVVFTAVDGSGSSTTFRTYVRSALSHTAALQAAAQLRGRLSAISGCCIVRVDVIYRDPYLVDEVGELQPSALFIFDCGPGQHAQIPVYGLLPDLVDLVDPFIVNVSAPPISAFVDELTSGIWCNPFAYDLQHCIEGIVQIRP